MSITTDLNSQLVKYIQLINYFSLYMSICKYIITEKLDIWLKKAVMTIFVPYYFLLHLFVYIQSSMHVYGGQ